MGGYGALMPAVPANGTTPTQHDFDTMHGGTYIEASPTPSPTLMLSVQDKREAGPHTNTKVELPPTLREKATQGGVQDRGLNRRYRRPMSFIDIAKLAQGSGATLTANLVADRLVAPRTESSTKYPGSPMQCTGSEARRLCYGCLASFPVDFKFCVNCGARLLLDLC